MTEFFGIGVSLRVVSINIIRRLAISIGALFALLAVVFCAFLGLIGGPKRLDNFIVRPQVIRTLEVIALVKYAGKATRLTMRTECVSPGDYMRAVSMEAWPEVIAATLPDGSAIAFREMRHLCELAEVAITEELNNEAGPRVLRAVVPVPALPAVWFAHPSHPDVVEEFLVPDVITPRYQPLAFSMREVPTEPGHQPAAAVRKTLPAWSRFEERSLSLCSTTIERLSPDMLSVKAQRDLAAGSFRPQELRADHLKVGVGTFPGAQTYFSVPGEVEMTPELRELLDRRAVQRSRTFMPILENGVWVARPLQAIRYYAASRGLPDKVRFGSTILEPRNRWIAPIAGTRDAATFQMGCSPQ